MLDINSSRITLSSSTSERDLGVILSTNLKSTTQTNRAASKANSMLGLLKRTFNCRDPNLWKKLYTTYIRPQLEFAVAAWNPSLKKDITTLEKVQRRATKVPHLLKHLEYKERCVELKLCSLEYRRLRGDLIQQYKILNNIDIVNWHNQPLSRPPRGGHRGMLVKELVRNCRERSHFFNNRIVNHWNSLPDSVVFAKSLNSFKANLDKHLSIPFI